jgi:predicted ATP-grasp superfamily ATP-dependent carboligase
MRYRGVFSAEFKRDERDVEYRILELNTRPWWYVEFAARCGVNVCAMAYRDAQGLDVEKVTSYAVGRRCVFPYYDFYACSALRRAGRMSLRAWVSAWVGATQPVLTWRDPMPGVRAGAAVLFRWLRRLLRWPRGERRRRQP